MSACPAHRDGPHARVVLEAVAGPRDGHDPVGKHPRLADYILPSQIGGREKISTRARSAIGSIFQKTTTTHARVHVHVNVCSVRAR